MRYQTRPKRNKWVRIIGEAWAVAAVVGLSMGAIDLIKREGFSISSVGLLFLVFFFAFATFVFSVLPSLTLLAKWFRQKVNSKM